MCCGDEVRGLDAGFIVGGNLVKLLHWRTLFFILAGLQLPVIIFCLLIPLSKRKCKRDAMDCPKDNQGEPQLDCSVLLSNLSHNEILIGLED
jgi:predicted MFS family arabinose efflux permease